MEENLVAPNFYSDLWQIVSPSSCFVLRHIRTHKFYPKPIMIIDLSKCQITIQTLCTC